MRLTTRAALVDACSMSFSHVVATMRLGTTARKPMRLTVRGAVVVPDHRDSSERSFTAIADLLVQGLAPNSSAGARKGGINFHPWLRTPC